MTDPVDPLAHVTACTDGLHGEDAAGLRAALAAAGVPVDHVVAVHLDDRILVLSAGDHRWGVVDLDPDGRLRSVRIVPAANLDEEAPDGTTWGALRTAAERVWTRRCGPAVRRIGRPPR